MFCLLVALLAEYAFDVAEDIHRLSGKKGDVFEISKLDPGEFRDAALKDAVKP